MNGPLDSTHFGNTVDQLTTHPTGLLRPVEILTDTNKHSKHYYFPVNSE